MTNKAPENRDKENMGEYYTISNSPTIGTNTIPISIRNCDYAGITYRYNTVGIKEIDDEDGGVVLSFSYEIVDDNLKIIDDPHDFELFIGDILFHILVSNQLVSGDQVDENRDTNSSEPIA